MKKKPIGVLIFGGFLILNGLTPFVLSIALLFKPIDFAAVFVEKGILTGWSIIIGAGVIALGWNIIKLREWARRTIVIISWLSICAGILVFFAVRDERISSIFSVAIFLLVARYFTHPKVKEQFK